MSYDYPDPPRRSILPFIVIVAAVSAMGGVVMLLIALSISRGGTREIAPSAQPEPSNGYPAAYEHQSPTPARTVNEAAGCTFIVFLLIIGIFFYFMPTYVAASAQHQNAPAIIVLNVAAWVVTNWLGCRSGLVVHHGIAASH